MKKFCKFLVISFFLVFILNGSKVNAGGADDLVNYANSQEGKMAADYGFYSDWCTYFVEWCGAESGLTGKGLFPNKNSIGYVGDLCAWFGSNDKGIIYYIGTPDPNIDTSKNAYQITKDSFTPQRGDLVFFRWDGYVDYGHVGIVTGYENGTTYFTHGNYGAAYYTDTNVIINDGNSYCQSHIVAYVRPNYYSVDNVVIENEVYDRSQTLEYAKNHVSDGKFGYTFISECVMAGGTPINVADGFPALMSMLDISQLGDFYELDLMPDNSIKGDVYNGILMPGDVVFYYCPAETDVNPWVYCVLCNGFDENGYMKAFSSYSDKSNGESAYRFSNCPFCRTKVTKAKVFHFEPRVRFGEYRRNVTFFYPQGTVESVSVGQSNTAGKNAINVKGFNFDRDDLSESLDVIVRVGETSSSRKELFTIHSDKTREDINTAYGITGSHGFEDTLEVSLGGTQDVYFYSTNVDGGDTVYLGKKTIDLPEIILPNALSGSVIVSGSLKYGKTLTAEVTGSNNTGTLKYQWKRGSNNISGATASTYKLTKSDIGKTISCVVTSSVESGSISGTASGTVAKADGPAAPTGLSSAAATSKGAADGSILGVTTAMEYATNANFSDSKACTGTTITGLTAGTYYVRLAETATRKAGAQATVTVADGPEKQNEERVYEDMFRLYNPNSGEHFYTASTEERDNLINAGWRYEGIAWKAPKYAGTPVFRLYNPNAGDHHYTMSNEEMTNLIMVGWNFEGIGFYSDESKAVPLFRLYNPNALQAGAHHYTTSTLERDNLVSCGWNYEGVGWFGAK